MQFIQQHGHARLPGCHGRTAALVLHPVRDAFPAPAAREMALSWDEANGWSLTFPAPAGPAQGSRSEGLRVLPGPGEVAVWAVVLLTHTGLAASRGRHPSRDHAVCGPDFGMGPGPLRPALSPGA